MTLAHLRVSERKLRAVSFPLLYGLSAIFGSLNWRACSWDNFLSTMPGDLSAQIKVWKKIAGKTVLCIKLERRKWVETRTDISTGQDSKQRHVVIHWNDGLDSIKSCHHFVFRERCEVVDIKPTRSQCSASMRWNQLRVELGGYRKFMAGKVEKIGKLPCCSSGMA